MRNAIKTLILLSLCLLCFFAQSSEVRQPKVVILVASESLADHSEGRYAENVAKAMQNFLSAAGISSQLSDEQSGPMAIANADVVILPYNPHPRKHILDALSSVLKRGGKLFVFYCATPELASMMGFEMGEYCFDERPGRWSTLRFTEGALPHAPLSITQQTRNIRKVFPKRNDACILAHWENVRGQLSTDPAFLRSDSGFWMTYILSEDADLSRKECLLASMFGYFYPDIWKLVAENYIGPSCRVGKWRGFNEAADALKKSGNNRAGILLTEGMALYGRIRLNFRQGKYAESYTDSMSLRNVLLRGYGVVHSLPDTGVRGVWDHTGVGLYPGDWTKTTQLLGDAGITDLYVNLLWPWESHYPEGPTKESRLVGLYGDIAEDVLKSAHENGLRVHAWKVCWDCGSAPASVRDKLRTEGRLQVSVDGRSINWLCPSDSRNIISERKSVHDLIKRYPFDGIHLDYVRYRGGDVCYCVGCKNRFQKDTGIKISKWPNDVMTGKNLQIFREWRVKQITASVRTISALVKRERSSTLVTAAVYGKYPSCVPSVGQDWVEWVKKRYVDYVVPMNYTEDINKFAEYTKSQIALAGVGGKIVPGIGVTSVESRLDAAQVIDQAKVAIEMKSGGFVLFDLNKELENHVLPIIKEGVLK